ncbi:RNA polymerase sigma factor [Jiangella asiatica]|uniref:RNA polymerase sigma factor n=1 Tax=Jiangella asiatica TaxID=2530372 RepID=A0A4R5DNE8_9ACTN|nr:RNA polymerase sigma factor [Jiangella asiatica]TDE15077.1 RNA polymerase sigma factor [Jiangella asiatica]
MSERAADPAEAVFREEWGRLLATLVRWLGDFDLAEEVAAEAMAAAVERWPVDGVPDRPGGWLLTTARRRAVDTLRRRQNYAAKLAVLKIESERAETERLTAPVAEPDVIGDDRLRLFFTCCHPALGAEARVALTLRYLAGLSTAQVARAFLVPEGTMAQRLVRAKHKIGKAGIPYRVPSAAELPGRLPAVLRVVYVIFTEAYAASSGAALVQPDLAGEAIRLARILHGLLPAEPEVGGLLALLLLVDARRPARVDDDGELVLLEDQDRSRWNHAMIDEGRALVTSALRHRPPGPYALQAAIAAVHDEAPSLAETDWRQIVALYDVLRATAPSPVVDLNRAVAVAMLLGPEAGLALIDTLVAAGTLDRYHPLHAARGHLLDRLGRRAEAAEAYQLALELCGNDPERAFLERCLAAARAAG